MFAGYATLARFALPLALALSVAGNLGLLWALSAAKARADADLQAAIERGRADAIERHAGQQSALIELAELDRSLLLQDLREIAARAEQVRVVYRDRIRELPAPECAPGAERVEAVNAALRGGP